jgi:hypothetical protein
MTPDGAEASAPKTAIDTRPADVPRPASGRSRRRGAFVVAWTAVVVLLATVVATRWETIVQGLARTPRPVSEPAPPATSLTAPGAAEAALQEARILLAAGEVEVALRVLDRIPAHHPSWPFARQIRAEAEGSRRGSR